MTFPLKYRCSIYYLVIFLLVSACKEKENKHSNNTPAGIRTVKDARTNIALDKSPLDMSYYPIDYPKLKMGGNNKEQLVARIIYSRPSVDGRQIFGNLLRFGNAWRLGANEATELEFFLPVLINNKQVAAGSYILYCKPFPDHWTIILNCDLFTWGLKIDSTKDFYQVNIPITKVNTPIEIFTMEFRKESTGLGLVMSWDSIEAVLPITLIKSKLLEGSFVK